MTLEKFLSSRYFKIFSLLIWIFFFLRAFFYIDQNTSSVFFNDQWDFYPAGSWESSPNYFKLFFLQFGPHRMGLGHILSVALGHITSFDMRIEAFLGLLIFALNGFLAWLLKKRLCGGSHPLDIFLLILPLNLAQGEIFVAHINFYMGPIPQFLILTMAHCLAGGLSSYPRLILFSLLNFITLFSGYALFVGFLSPLVLLVLYSRSSSRLKVGILASFAFSIYSLWLFFNNYIPGPSSAAFQLHEKVWEYFIYFSFMFGRFVFEGKKGIPLILGIIVTTSFIVTVFKVLKALANELQNKKSPLPFNLLLTLCFLFGFACLYCASATLGRISMGVAQGSSSRYIPYLVIAIIALYIYGSHLKKLKLLTFLLAVFIFSETVWRQRDIQRTFHMYAEGKKNWQRCYLELESASECTKTTGFIIHPAASDRDFDQRLRVLKEKNWNLFKK